jgi:hypothetical protein
MKNPKPPVNEATSNVEVTYHNNLVRVHLVEDLLNLFCLSIPAYKTT